MNEYDQPREDPLPPIGQPGGKPDQDDQTDFAAEHNDTAVDEEIVTGADEDEREPESPHGWAGMER